MRVDLAMGASQHWKRAAALALLIGVVAVTTSVAAAVYPDRPLRLVVPSAAGGGPDTVARLIASEFTKHLGHQVVVDNRPGGAFTIGMDAIAKAASDGYTIGYASVGPLARGGAADATAATRGILERLVEERSRVPEHEGR